MAPLCLSLLLAAAPGLEARELDLLTSLLTAALDDDERLDVLSSEDLRTMLEAEANRQVADCADTSCLAELADAMGARFVVAADVGLLGRAHVMTITALDATAGRAANRRVIEAESAEALGRAAARAVRGLVDVEEQTRVLVLDVRAAGEARGAPAAASGPSPLLLAGGVTAGAGALLLAGGAGAWAFSLSESARARSGTQLEAAEAFGNSEAAALTGNVLLVAGALLAVGGGALAFAGLGE